MPVQQAAAVISLCIAAFPILSQTAEPMAGCLPLQGLSYLLAMWFLSLCVQPLNRLKSLSYIPVILTAMASLIYL